MKRVLVVAVGTVLAVLGVLGIVSAHAMLDHCTPGVSSIIAAAPAQIVCVYSEEIDTKLSNMTVSDSNGIQVDKKDAHVDLNDPDHKTLIVSLDTTLVKHGLYTVKWHSVTPDDNGVSDGFWQFVVGSASSTPYPPTIIVQGETPGAGTPSPNVAATSSPTQSNSAATVPPTPVASSTPAPSAAALGVTPTIAAPSIAPSTGGSAKVAWIALAVAAVAIIMGGILVRVRH